MLIYITRKWLAEHRPLALEQEPRRVLWTACPRCHAAPSQECKTRSMDPNDYHPLRLLAAHDGNLLSELMAQEQAAQERSAI